MKRVYSDLHLCPNVRNGEQIKQMMQKASELGYTLVAVSLPQNFSEQKIQEMRDICKITNMDFVSRVDLKPRRGYDLTRSLRQLRRRFEIVAVMCESKHVARQAAKDRRTDLLNFPSYNRWRRFFDKAEAELASNTLASLEVDVTPLLILENRERIKFLSVLRKEVAIAEDFHVPIIISSGASNELYMRGPREVAALASLFDLDKLSAKKAVSENPMAIVVRNRQKLNSKFVAPGIRVIRRGKGC